MRQSRYRLVPAMMILVATIVLPGCALQNLPPVAVYTLDPGWSEGNPSPIEKKRSRRRPDSPGSWQCGLYCHRDFLYR